MTNSDCDSVDSREGQLWVSRVEFGYDSDPRKFEEHAPYSEPDLKRARKYSHDSSILAQFFWGLEDEEMESRPTERKRKWKQFVKMRNQADRVFEQDAAEASAKSKASWDDLPMELLVRILALVDNRTVVIASGICRGWRESVGLGIQDLSFSWCGQSVSKLVHSVAPKFPRLQSCRLKRCTYLDDTALQAAATNWHGLKTLEVTDGTRLTDISLHALAKGCSRLEKLDLSCCTGITEVGLLAIVQRCNNLRHLNLWACCDAGTDRVLQALSRHCKALQSLNVGWCEKVTDKGVVTLAQGCSDLRVVDLCRCSLITDQSVIVLSEKCQRLCALGLSTCPVITDAAMHALIEARRRIPQQQQMKFNIDKNAGVKNFDSLIDFRTPRRHRASSTSSGSSTGSTCSDASKLPFKREGLDTLLENPNQHGLVCLNLSHCVSLSTRAVQAVCDAFPALHTCPEQQSLIVSGCANLTSVNCICANEARREKFNRDRRNVISRNFRL